MTCELHDSKNRYYCESCTKVFCAECDGGDHMGHKLQIIRNEVDSFCKSTSELLNDVNGTMNVVRSSIEAVEKMCESVDVRAIDVAEEIKTVFQRFQILLSRRESDILLKLDQTKVLKKRNLMHQNERLNEVLSKLNWVSNYMSESLTFGSSMDARLVKEKALNELRNMSELSELLTPQETDNFSFIEPDSQFSLSISQLGDISSHTVSSLAVGEGIAKAVRTSSYAQRALSNELTGFNSLYRDLSSTCSLDSSPLMRAFSDNQTSSMFLSQPTLFSNSFCDPRMPENARALRPSHSTFAPNGLNGSSELCIPNGISSPRLNGISVNGQRASNSFLNGAPTNSSLTRSSLIGGGLIRGSPPSSSLRGPNGSCVQTNNAHPIGPIVNSSSGARSKNPSGFGLNGIDQARSNGFDQARSNGFDQARSNGFDQARSNGFNQARSNGLNGSNLNEGNGLNGDKLNMNVPEDNRRARQNTVPAFFRKRSSNQLPPHKIRSNRVYQNIRWPAFTFGTEGEDAGELCRPWGICCDQEGNMVVADRSNNRIQIFNGDGEFIRQFGTGGTGEGEFDRPAGVAVDNNHRIIVADKDNHRIQIFTFEGVFLHMFGDKGIKSGQFNYPWDVATNSNGHILVSDTRNHRLQVFDAQGHFLRKYGFDPSMGPIWKQFDSPRGVCFDPRDLIVATDFNNHRIAVFDNLSYNFYFISQEGTEPNHLLRPQGIVCDRAGNFIVADSRNHRLQVIKYDGTSCLAQFGCFGDEVGQFDRPSGVALKPNGQIAVVDFGNNRVQVF